MKKKRITKSLPTPETYSDLIGSMSLQGVGLDSASIKIDRVSLAERTAAGETLGVNIDASFGVLHHSDESLIIGAKFKLSQTKKSSEEPVLLIDCAFSALYKLGISTTNEFAERFANTEAKLIFWPYLRHFIADTSYRMSINPILLPLMTAAEVKKSN